MKDIEGGEVEVTEKGRENLSTDSGKSSRRGTRTLPPFSEEPMRRGAREIADEAKAVGGREDKIEEEEEEGGGDDPGLRGEEKVNPGLKGKDGKQGGGSGGGRGAFVETLDVASSTRSPSSQCCDFHAPPYPSSPSCRS